MKAGLSYPHIGFQKQQNELPGVSADMIALQGRGSL